MSHQVVLSWTAPQQGDPPSSYSIRRASVQVGPFAVIGGSATTTFTDTTAVGGDTYWYEVESVNSAGSSSPVSAVSTTVPLVPPQAPTNLSILAS